MRFSLALPFFAYYAFATPVETSTILDPTERKRATFCKNAKAFIQPKDENAANAYCSSVLGVGPPVTVTTKISTVTKTRTSTTSIKTYLAKPLTTIVAASITDFNVGAGTKTVTITTSISTETHFFDDPIATCGDYYHGCQEKRDAHPQQQQNVLAHIEPKPTCLSPFTRSADISSICSCLSLTPATRTISLKVPGAPTTTVLRLTTGQTIRTPIRSITTGTVTITPSVLSTKTISAVATETLMLTGPFKLGKDNPQWSNSWLNAADYNSQDVVSSFVSGSGSCNGDDYALNGTTLLKLGWDSTGKKGVWNRVANINKQHGGGAFPLFFSTKDVLASEGGEEREGVTCKIGTAAKGASAEGRCPLVCRADGGKDFTQRDGKLYLGDEDEEHEGVGLFVFKDAGPNKEM